MRELTYTLDGHSVSLPAEPAALLSLGAALGASLLVLALMRGLMGPGERGTQATLLRLGWLASGLVPGVVIAASTQDGDVLQLFSALRGAMLAAGVVGWLAVGLVPVEAWLRWADRDPERGLRWRAWVELPLILALGVVLLAGSWRVRHAWSGVKVPAISASGCARIHQGVRCLPTLQLTVLGAPDKTVVTGGLFGDTVVGRPWFNGSEVASTGERFEELQGWRIPEQPVPSAKVGSTSYELYAVRGPLMLRTQIGPFSVVEDRGDPRVSTGPGSTWRFTSRVNRSQRVILLKHEHSSWEGEALLAQVGAPVEVEGLRLYPLKVKVGEEPWEERGHLLHVDGQTTWRFLGEDRPWLQVEQPARGEVPPEPFGVFDTLPEGGFECTLPFVDAVCVCAPAGTAPEQELAGPIHCIGSQNEASLGESLLLGFLAIATLGLTPGPGVERVEWALTSSAIEPPPM